MVERPDRHFSGVSAHKISREARRIKTQLFAAFHVWKVLGKIQRINYDACRRTRVQISDGSAGLFDDVAVVLIYQPDGVIESTKYQLDWLIAHSVSPVVVTNLTLTEHDRRELARRAHLVIERPNVGYDFGGYREGIQTIRERGIRPKNLFVLNDSIWLPLRADSDLIERSREAPEDIWGLFTDLDWKNRRKGGAEHHAHVQSYFFRFSEKLAASKDFANYWSKMPLVNDRRFVISMFETKFTRHFRELGYSAASLYDWTAFIHDLLSITDDKLVDRMLDHQGRIRDREARIISAMRNSGRGTAVETRDALCDQIRLGEVFSSIFYVYPEFQTRHGIPFLKKGRTAELARYRKELLRTGTHRDFADPIRREVEAWDEGQVEHGKNWAEALHNS